MIQESTNAPGEMIDNFVELLMGAGQKHFAKAPPPTAAYDPLRAERLALLGQRRALRLDLAAADSLGAAATIQAKLKQATKTCKRLRREAARRDRSLLVEDMRVAHAAGRATEASALARRLAGTGRGARRRDYRAIPQAMPDQEELIRMLGAS